MVQADDEHNFHVQNDEHPVSNMAVGEKLLYDVYQAVRNGPAWRKTLLIITYDEHGGTYDHAGPPPTAIPPDDLVAANGFDFTRFGVRVPSVVVSPLVPQGTILRPPAGGPPFDHTSIIATLRARFGIAALGKRDAAAPSVGSAVSLADVANTPSPGSSLRRPLDPLLSPVRLRSAPPSSSSLHAKAEAVAAFRFQEPRSPIRKPPSQASARESSISSFSSASQPGTQPVAHSSRPPTGSRSSLA